MVRHSSLDHYTAGQIDKLSLILRRAENGVIILLECNELPLREEVINRLKEGLKENFKFFSIKLEEKNKNLPGIVREYSGSGEIDKNTVVFVHNINAGMPEIISYLNWGREVFLDFKVKIVIFCPTFIVDEIIKDAPDFYRFSHKITIREKTTAAGETLPSFVSDIRYKDINELDERIKIHEHLLRKTTEDYKIADLSFNLGRMYFKKSDYKNSLEFFNNCLKIYERTGNKGQTAATYNNIGKIHYSQGNYSLALEWFDKSREIQEKIGDTAGLAITYNNIGEIHRAQGDYSLALEWYNKDREISEKIGDAAGLAGTYNNIGLIHYAQGNYSLALKWYNKSREIFEKIGDTAGIARTYNNIAAIHYAQGNYSLAVEWYDKSREITEKMGDAATLATTYGNIGSIYHAQGNEPLALEWFNKSREIQEKIGDTAGLATTYHNIGYIYSGMNDLKTALDYFTKSRDIYKKIGLEKGAAEEEEMIKSIKSKIKS